MIWDIHTYITSLSYFIELRFVKECYTIKPNLTCHVLIYFFLNNCGGGPKLRLELCLVHTCLVLMKIECCIYASWVIETVQAFCLQKRLAFLLFMKACELELQLSKGLVLFPLFRTVWFNWLIKGSIHTIFACLLTHYEKFWLLLGFLAFLVVFKRIVKNGDTMTLICLCLAWKMIYHCLF